CAAEIHRVAAKGCHSVTFTENPATLGLPSFHSPHWDPVWQAMVDEGSILNIHLGSSGQLAVTAADAPMDVMITLQPMNICTAAAEAAGEARRVAATDDVPHARVHKTTHQNGLRWYRLEPFAPRPREQCTVGALRAEVEGHDVSIRSMDQGRFGNKGPMSLAE